MLSIYLGRHGEDTDEATRILSGRRDEPLTQEGMQQAEELTRVIWSHGLHFTAVYASPLQRAYRTAEIITDTLELPKPMPRANLVDRACGEFTGEPQETIPARCGNNVITSASETYFLTAPNAETFPELLARTRTMLDDIKANHGDTGNVLVITHELIAKMLFAAYYNLEWQPVISMLHLDHAGLLKLSPDCSPAEAQLYKK